MAHVSDITRPDWAPSFDFTAEHEIYRAMRRHFWEHKLSEDHSVLDLVINYLCENTGFRCDRVNCNNNNPALLSLATALVGEPYEQTRLDMAEVGVVVMRDDPKFNTPSCHILVAVNEKGVITQAIVL
jgi:hypothetical protein